MKLREIIHFQIIIIKVDTSKVALFVLSHTFLHTTHINVFSYVVQCIHWTAKFIFRCIVWYDSDQLQYCNALCRGFFFLFRRTTAIHETLKPFYKSQVAMPSYALSSIFRKYFSHSLFTKWYAYENRVQEPNGS